MSIDNGAFPLSANSDTNFSGRAATPKDPLANTKDASDKLKSSASGVINDAKNLASEAAGDAQAYAGNVAADASAFFKEAVETRKTAGADAIAGLARTAQDAADKYSDQSPQVARMVKNAAEGVEKVSSDIRDRSMGDLMDSFSDFAKRKPATLFGCGILAGIVLSRIIRSSNR